MGKPIYESHEFYQKDICPVSYEKLKNIDIGLRTPNLNGHNNKFMLSHYLWYITVHSHTVMILTIEKIIWL